MDEVQTKMVRFVGPTYGRSLFDAYRHLLPSASPARLWERFLNDAIYRIPAVRTAYAHGAAGGEAHMYQFAWESQVHSGTLGASHALDEPFVWGKIDPEFVPFVGAGEDAKRVADEMSTALLRFAATGDPGWSTYSSATPKSRVFDPTGARVEDVESPVLTAWEGVERQ